VIVRRDAIWKLSRTRESAAERSSGICAAWLLGAGKQEGSELNGTVLHAMYLLGGSKSKSKSKTVPKKRRRMSATGKAKIASAQKARLAKVRARKKKSA
jgi:hypothetical protein